MKRRTGTDIQDIIERFRGKEENGELESITLDYMGDIEEFGSLEWIPEEIRDEIATSRYKDGELKIIVK